MKNIFILTMILGLVAEKSFSEVLNIQEYLSAFNLIESSKKSDYVGWEAGFEPYIVSIGSEKITSVNKVVWKSDIVTHSPEESCDDIHYTGSDEGEWGGELLVSNGKAKPKVILKGNIYHLIKWGEGLYVFIGSQHGVSGGEVHYIRDCSVENLTIDFVTILPDAPVSVHLYSRIDLEQFLIVGNTTLIRLSPSLNSMTIAKFNPWKGLKPYNSVLVDDTNLLVGLMSGVATVEFSKSPNPLIRLFVPKK